MRGIRDHKHQKLVSNQPMLWGQGQGAYVPFSLKPAETDDRCVPMKQRLPSPRINAAGKVCLGTVENRSELAWASRPCFLETPVWPLFESSTALLHPCRTHQRRHDKHRCFQASKCSLCEKCQYKPWHSRLYGFPPGGAWISYYTASISQSKTP